MLSGDLQSLRGALACYAERLDGRLFFGVADTADLLGALDGLIDQAQRMEAATVAAPRTRDLPHGVTDLVAARRRREATPIGGPAA